MALKPPTKLKLESENIDAIEEFLKLSAPTKKDVENEAKKKADDQKWISFSMRIPAELAKKLDEKKKFLSRNAYILMAIENAINESNH